MNEKQIQTLMQNLDNDLLASELDDLMKDMEIDLDSITKKAYAKLNKERLKMKRKKIYPIMAASLIAVVGISTVYASDISDFVKSFFNQKAIYSTVAEGSAYYLKTPLQLDKESKLENVIFTKDTLEMNLTLPLADKDKLPPIIVTSADGSVYKPSSYGYDKDLLLLSFWNEEEQNYVFAPTKELQLDIGEKSYAVYLEEGAPVIGSGEIKPAEHTDVDWINVGYKKTEQGVQILTSFSDADLKLVNIGEPAQKIVTQMFKNENGIIGSGTSAMTKPLIGYDKGKTAYVYSPAANAVGRPITQFESKAPAGEEITLEIPSLIVGYERDFGKFSIAIPGLNEEKTIDQEIDLKLQKIVLQSIKRTSATSAELTFVLNTGGATEVAVWEANFYSKDVQSGESVWQDGICTLQINFDEELKNAEFNVSWPRFIVNGDWALKVNS